jgi:hypothetical protein
MERQRADARVRETARLWAHSRQLPLLAGRRRLHSLGKPVR